MVIARRSSGSPYSRGVVLRDEVSKSIRVDEPFVIGSPSTASTIRGRAQVTRSSKAMMSRCLPSTECRAAARRLGVAVRWDSPELIDEDVPLREQVAAGVVGRDLPRGVDVIEASEDLIHLLGSG